MRRQRVALRTVERGEGLGAPPPRRNRAAALGLALVLLAAGVAGGVVLAGLTPLPDPLGTRTVDRSQPVLLQSIQDLSVYKAAVGNFTAVIDLEKDAPLLPSFLKGERTIFLAVGTVDAEVDFSSIGEDAIAVSADGRSVTVTLPPPRLGAVRVDPERSRVLDRQRGVLDRVGGLFSESPTSERELYVVAEERLQAAAVSSGIRERAEANTRAMLQGMLRSLGYRDVTVVFKDTGPAR